MNTPQEFSELVTACRRLERDGFAHGAALATLTRTRGSTFRRPGAWMLVCGDGTVIRGLSGGCPEADIIARAKEVIVEQRARIVRYGRESGLDVMIELGCGGELEVLIEPLRCADDLRFLAPLERCMEARTRGFVATLFARNGLCLEPRPRRLAYSAGAVREDDFKDERLSAKVVAEIQSFVQASVSVEQLTIDSDTFEVLIEKLEPPHALFVIGVNAGAGALMHIGAQLGWDTTLIGHRPDLEGSSHLPPGGKFVYAPAEIVIRDLTFDARTAVVVMTFNLERDISYIRALSDTPLAYLGVIGSRDRCRKLCDATGLSPPRLHAPAGLDLGSETPEEIALAIAAEILASLTGREGGKLSTSACSIH